MTGNKNKVNESGGKIVLDGFSISYIFGSLVRKNVLPKGKIAYFYTNDMSIDNKIVIDVGKNKFICYIHVTSLDKNPFYTIYRKYIYDLDKINLDVFFEIAITIFSEMLPELALRRIIGEFSITLQSLSLRNSFLAISPIIRLSAKNEFLKERLCKVIENSPKLKRILLKKIKNLKSLI